MVAAFGGACEAVVAVHAVNGVNTALAIVTIRNAESDAADTAADRGRAEIVDARGDAGVVARVAMSQWNGEVCVVAHLAMSLGLSWSGCGCDQNLSAGNEHCRPGSSRVQSERERSQGEDKGRKKQGQEGSEGIDLFRM